MFLNKKILCLIPARGGSKGIKYKNLKKIGKKSLVENSIRFAKSLKWATTTPETTVDSNESLYIPWSNCFLK